MKYEVRWTELQTYHTVVEADTAEEAIRMVGEGEYEEAHDSGWAPDKEIYDVEELNE